MPVIRQNQHHRKFRVGAARHSQRTSSGHSRYQMALKVELLHPEMPVCRSLSFILHNVSFQPSPSNKAACRSAYLEWGYVYVDPATSMSSALPTDPSITMHLVRSAISSSYASLTWVWKSVVAVLPYGPSLSRQDANFHLEFTRYLEAFSYGH